MMLLARYGRKSIWRQLLLFLVFAIALLSVASSVTAVWVSFSQTRQMLEQNSLRIARNLANLSVLSLITASEENAQEALSQVLGFNDVTGVAIFTSSYFPLLQQGDVSWESVKLRDWFAIDQPSIVQDSSDAWLIAAPVLLNADQPANRSGAYELSLENEAQQLLGYVMIKVSKDSLAQLSRNLISYIAIITLMISLLLIWLLNRVLKRLTRPLFKLSETMNQAQTSGEHTFAVVEGPKEVRQMAKSFNAMMLVLEQQEDKLVELNTGLESEVEVRTRELVAARDAALVAVHTQSEFLANISHELRTPLQAVMGYIELVMEEFEFHTELEAQVEDLSSALKSSRRLLELINSILELAKCEAGKMDLVKQQCSLQELLRETEKTIRPLAAKQHNRFEMEYPSTDQLVYLDRDKVLQVLLNLLSNACKFTEHGTIRLSCKPEQNKIYWQVADTGIGIPEEKLDQIFNKFKQVDGSVKRKHGGTGLGLAISKHFAEMMGGSLAVSSELGKGSVFTFCLEMSVEQPASAIHSPITE